MNICDTNMQSIICGRHVIGANNEYKNITIKSNQMEQRFTYSNVTIFMNFVTHSLFIYLKEKKIYEHIRYLDMSQLDKFSH